MTVHKLEVGRVIPVSEVVEVLAAYLHQYRNQAQVERCLSGISPRADEVIEALEAVRDELLGQ